MQVSLSPLVYVKQPEYWGIEVIDRLANNVGIEPSAYCLQAIIAIGRLDESFDASQQIPQWL